MPDDKDSVPDDNVAIELNTTPGAAESKEDDKNRVNLRDKEGDEVSLVVSADNKLCIWKGKKMRQHGITQVVWRTT